MEVFRSFIESAVNNFEDYVILPRQEAAFFEWLKRQDFADDMLSRYRLNLFQINETNEENVRLGNLASTRMSRVQQQLFEGASAVGAFYEQLRAIPQLTDQLDSLNQHIDELNVHFLQTEIAMASLEKICEAVTNKTT